jgi:ethanolaminephosphotransferase
MSSIWRIHAYVDESKLDNLKSYSYHGEDHSLLAAQLQPFWSFLARQLPAWLAPNLITLIGLVAVVAGYAAVCVFVPELTPAATAAAPAWLWLCASASLFVYQTLDALDGKQARRTGTSSPLGELFDHGCDAISTAMCVLLASAALQYEPWMNTVSICTAMLAFYVGQWEEFHTGTLYLGYVNVTEALVAIELVLVAAAVVGPTYLRESGVSALVFYGSTAAAVVSAAQYFYRTVAALRRLKQSVAAALLRLVPIVALVSVSFLWARFSRVDVGADHHYAFANIVGLTGSALVGRLVLARMLKSDVSPFQWSLVPLTLVAANDALLDTPLVDPHTAIVGLVVYCAVAYLHFAMYVITTLCATLGIRCLTITPKVAAAAVLDASASESTAPSSRRSRSRSPARSTRTQSRSPARAARSNTPTRAPSQRTRAEPEKLNL